MKAALAVIGAIVVVLVGYLAYRYWQLQRLAAKYATAKEIAAESIEKEGAKWSVHMESVLARPIDKVWRALRQPERSHEFIEAFRKSDLKKEEGNTKVIEFQVQVLTLPLQSFVVELAYDDAGHRVALRTLSGPQDQNATYQLTAVSADKTLLVLDGTAVDRITVPLPLSVQRGAMRELFVHQVRAIEKGIAADEAKSNAPG
ncbi:MAG: SRPBCC family protein [Deltaproteobacteria bacterium]|nr:SRPBCC family protein [Deltaproteobacteria bacterium]